MRALSGFFVAVDLVMLFAISLKANGRSSRVSSPFFARFFSPRSPHTSTVTPGKSKTTRTSFIANSRSSSDRRNRTVTDFSFSPPVATSESTEARGIFFFFFFKRRCRFCVSRGASHLQPKGKKATQTRVLEEKARREKKGGQRSSSKSKLGGAMARVCMREREIERERK